MQEEDDSVCYWRMTRPQVDHWMAQQAEQPEEEDEANEQEEYEILWPSDASTHAILLASEFGDAFVPKMDAFSSFVFGVCDSLPVRTSWLVADSLVRRFTDFRFNWETKTLRSFLEVACWISVTYAAFSLSGDFPWAFQVGTFVGALMSVCDELGSTLAKSLALVIRNQPGGNEFLVKAGFDVPSDGKAPTDGREVLLINNLVFGYLGLATIRFLWENLHDVKYFSLLTAAIGVCFVLIAEFCCLWLPTRRLGLTLQSRWTNVAHNWRHHTRRSLWEVTCWISSTVYFYFLSSNDFLQSLRLGTMLTILICVTNGLDQLPGIDPDPLMAKQAAFGFWQDHLEEDVYLWFSSWLFFAQDLIMGAAKWMHSRALDLMENFGA